MREYHASIQHNEASVTGFAKAQFLLFESRKRIALILAGAGLLILGAVLPETRALSLILLLAGCLVLIDIPYVPRRTARQILRYSKLPGSISFVFRENIINVLADGRETNTAYNKISRFAEDKSFFHLFLNRGMAYTITKESLEPDDIEGFRAMIRQNTGLSCEQISGLRWFRFRT